MSTFIDDLWRRIRKIIRRYEEVGKGRKTIKARELWEKILESQIETGTPYMLV